MFDTFRKEMEKIQDQFVLLPFWCLCDGLGKGGIEKLLWEQVGNKNVEKREKTTRRRADAWGHFKWSVPIHVTGWKFLNCVINYRYEETEEWTPLHLNLYGNKKKTIVLLKTIESNFPIP
ncbi:hypothetical protein TNCV_5005511 [Trichonephila clavipes]|nr:hypothetical protein TNCV_5005511 [Trichonephila clavipes]